MQVSLERPHQPFFPDVRFWEMYPDDIDPPDTLNQDPSHRPPHFRMTYENFRTKWNWPIEPDDFDAHASRMWRAYLACITHVDYALGLLLDHLDREGLADNTIVVYHADHGGYSGVHGLLEKAPGICSESVCRIPFLWRVPGMEGSSGSVCEQFVENVDIAPTISSLCGLPRMETVDGKDISPLIGGDDNPIHEVAVTENPWSRAIRWDGWRFVHYQPEMFGEDVGELYDLENDPDEARNLYHDPDSQEMVHRSRRLLLEWLIRTTRVVTAWPSLGQKGRFHDFSTAGDGKESNEAGAAKRVNEGQLNYI
jgi:choline-sulfatase/uncharacterized sulfatase